MRILYGLVFLALCGSAQGQVFRNCTEARQAGYTDIPSSSAFYSRQLDRDNDGVACEANGNDAPYRYDPSRPFVLPNANTSGGGSSSTPMVIPIYSPSSPEPPDLMSLKVYRVIAVKDDGHFILNYSYQDFTFHLLGLDLPSGAEPQAVSWLKRVLPINSLVFVDFEPSTQLVQGSLGVYLWLDRQLVNAQGLMQGLYALSPTYGGRYASFYKAGQQLAQDEGVGIWQKSPTSTPGTTRP